VVRIIEMKVARQLRCRGVSGKASLPLRLGIVQKLNGHPGSFSRGVRDHSCYASRSVIGGIGGPKLLFGSEGCEGHHVPTRCEEPVTTKTGRGMQMRATPPV
jgi:hypothetical protein